MSDFANLGDLANLEPVAQPAAKQPDVGEVASSMRKQIVKSRFSGGSFRNTTAVVATVQKMRAHAKDPTAHAALQMAEQDLTEAEKEALAKATPTPAPKAAAAVPAATDGGDAPKSKGKDAKKAKPAEKGDKPKASGKGEDGKQDAPPAAPSVQAAAPPAAGEAPAQDGKALIEQQLALHEQWEKAESAELKGKLGDDVKQGLKVGLVQGVASTAIGVAIQGIAKKIPIEGAGNVIGLGVMIFSAGGITGLGKQIGDKGKKVADAAKGLFSNENWALKLADLFSLITNVAEIVATVANILSGAAYALAGLSAVLAALGWILSFFFPPLAAVAALLTEAVEPLMSFGKLAGTVANVATLVNMVLSPLPPIFRAVGIELIADDPEQIEAEEDKFKDETEEAVSAYTGMATNATTHAATDGEYGGQSPFQKGSFAKAFGIDEFQEAGGDFKEKAHDFKDDAKQTLGIGSKPAADSTAPPKDPNAAPAAAPKKEPTYAEAQTEEAKAKTEEQKAKSEAEKAKAGSEAAKQKVADAEKTLADAEKKYEAAKAAADEEKKSQIETEARGGGQVDISDPEHGPNADELAKMDELPPAEKEAIKAKHELDEAKKELEEAKHDAKEKEEESEDADKEAQGASTEVAKAKGERQKAFSGKMGTGIDVLKDALKKPAKQAIAGAMAGKEEETVMLPAPPAPGSLAVVNQLDAEIQRLSKLDPAIAAVTQHAAGMQARAQHDANLLKHAATGFQSQQQARMQAGTQKQQGVDAKGKEAESKFAETATTGKGGTGKGAGVVGTIAHMVGWLAGLAHKVPDSKFFHTKPLVTNVDKFKKGIDIVAGGPAKGDEAIAPSKPRIQQRHAALAKATAARGKTQQATTKLHGTMTGHAAESQAAAATAGSTQQESAAEQKKNAAALAATKQKRAAEWAKWMTWANANKAKYDEWKEQQKKKQAGGGAE